MILRYLERSNVRNCLYDINIPSSILKFSLRVTESSTDGESSRKNSDWPDDEFRVGIAVLCLLRQLFFLIENLRRSSLIDLTSRLDDAFVFFSI